MVKSRDMDVDFVLSGISGLFFKHIAVKIMTIEETLCSGTVGCNVILF